MKLLKQLLVGMLLLCLKLPSFAQAETDTSFAAQMNSIFANLEKTRIPYGILKDYGMEFTNLNQFNGKAALSDSNYTDGSTFWDVYKSLVMSRIHSNAIGFLRSDTIDNRWYSYRQFGRITLAGLYFNYTRFKDNAEGNYITVSNNQLFDKYVNGVWQNPYQTEQAFLLSPSITEYEGKSFELILPLNLWLTNSYSSISSISLNLSDGNGYRTLVPGTALNINYADTGYKEWTYRLTLTNNSILYAHSKIHVKESIVRSDNVGARFGTTNPEMIAMTATEAYLGKYASGTITIKYADVDKGLRRPLIVVEGYDPGHILAPEKKFGFTNINTFQSDIDNSNSTNLELLLGSNFTNQYDIIYLDWKNGTDYLQRNALLLETVIRWINTNKEPLSAGVFASNVVIGQSMGGVIARYALKDMENKGENHNVRLYISHDAPHQGANVPQGYQHLARHARNLYIRTGFTLLAIETVQFLTGGSSPFMSLSVSDQPASKQMLINFVNNSNNIDNSMHTAWQTELQNLGYPNGDGITAFRKVSVSNGSECGTPQAFGAGANLMTFQGQANTRFLGDIAGLVGFPVANILLGQPALLLGIIPGSNSFNFDFAVNAQADGSSNQVYKGKITYTKKVLWVIPATVTITNKSYNSNPTTLPYDYFPGGYYDLSAAGFNLQNSSYQNILIKYAVTASNQPTFNFVPTTSALDIGNGAVSLGKSDFLTSYVSSNPPAVPKNTPFNNFITAFNGGSNNEQHISIERRNGDWIADELNGNIPIADCSTYCNLQISGSSCLKTSSQYSIPVVLNSNTSVTWRVSSNIVTLQPNGNQVTVNQAGHGIVTLYADVTSSCGSFTISKKLDVDVPYVTIDISSSGSYSELPANYTLSDYNSVCNYQNVNLNMYITGASTSSWSKVSSNPTNLYWEQTGNNLGFYFYNVGQSALYRITATNSCGTTSKNYGFKSIDCSGGGGGCEVYAASPNPASESIDITVPNIPPPPTCDVTAAQLAQSDITEVTIYDQSGTMKRKLNYSAKTKKVHINLNGLKTGIYIFEIGNKAHKERKQIVVTQ